MGGKTYHVCLMYPDKKRKTLQAGLFIRLTFGQCGCDICKNKTPINHRVEETAAWKQDNIINIKRTKTRETLPDAYLVALFYSLTYLKYLRDARFSLGS